MDQPPQTLAAPGILQTTRRNTLRLALVGAALWLGLLAGAPTASAFFEAPPFVRQWEVGPANASGGASLSITVDPFGDLYVLQSLGGGSAQIHKYHDDGTPAAGSWAPLAEAGGGGIAADPQGHLYLGIGSRLLEFTSSGGLLAEFQPPQFADQVSLAIDHSGNIYATGTDAGGKPSLNEYARSGNTLALIGSASFPGTPDSHFSPNNFLGLAVDESGNVFASGISTSERFLLEYGPGLSGPPTYLESCPNAGQCFGGFGIASATASASEKGVNPAPVVFAAGGYGKGAPSEDFYKTGVYATPGGALGTSQYLGSFATHPLASKAGTDIASVAASPCHASLYLLVNVFGGPNTTIDENVVQQFGTRAPATPCALVPVAAVSGFSPRYLLRPLASAKGPCTPCAAFSAAGAYLSALGASGAPAGAEAASAKKPKGKGKAKKGGVWLKFNSSAAADATFTLTRKAKGKRKAKTVGGFVYPALAGANAVQFSGVLSKGHPLAPGTYMVGVTAGSGKTRFKIEIPPPGR